MENLIIEASSKTPAVSFGIDGKMELSGRSIPENAIDFYKPLYDWLDAFAANPCSQVEINIKLEYFNTSSSKCLLDVFKKAEAIGKTKNSQVKINWYYEVDDEDMLEAGEDYDIIISIPFKFIEVESL
ncbi:MAG: DUF1987 domain-containing protein [Flavobacteriales bacterium]|nr:DUF1987 domain-containing protein [Flavobacteriales bacterium]